MYSPLPGLWQLQACHPDDDNQPHGPMREMHKYASAEGEDELRVARQWDTEGLLEMVTRGDEGSAALRKQAGQQLLMGRGGNIRWNRRLTLLVCVALVFVVATFCRHLLPARIGWAWYSEQRRQPPIRSSASYGLPSAVDESDCPNGMTCFHRARSVSPRDLLAGSYAHGNATTTDSNSSTGGSAIPRLLHQSWGQKSMPERVSRWSNQCRMLHPDWQYVLWTDEDNRELIKHRYSWFLPTYDALQSNIKRADAVRNLYMHAFGGVYLDFDVECIRPFDILFELHSKEEGGKTLKQAFLGRMGSDDNHPHSIPNDWMASSPGHPFFLLPIDVILSTLQHEKVKPEDETGPVPLRDQLLRYQASLQRNKDHLKASLESLPVELADADSRAAITVLDEHVIHPYSWTKGSKNRQGRACLGYLDTFDPDRCKELLQVQEKGTFAIAYWTHSWEGVDQLDYR